MSAPRPIRPPDHWYLVWYYAAGNPRELARKVQAAGVPVHDRRRALDTFAIIIANTDQLEPHQVEVIEFEMTAAP